MRSSDEMELGEIFPITSLCTKLLGDQHKIEYGDEYSYLCNSIHNKCKCSRLVMIRHLLSKEDPPNAGSLCMPSRNWVPTCCLCTWHHSPSCIGIGNGWCSPSAIFDWLLVTKRTLILQCIRCWLAQFSRESSAIETEWYTHTPYNTLGTLVVYVPWYNYIELSFKLIII